MVNLSKRSYQKELLDNDDIPFADIKQNMKELDIINSCLGGHAISINGLKQIVQHFSLKKISICEIGCGGGDNLLAINKWCRKQHITASFTGIDIKEECIRFAKKQCHLLPNATWVAEDYAKANFKNEKPAIIFASLFCHHFNEAELIKMLQWMKQHSTKGFFINDLQRHPLAYYSIKFITAFFSSSYLVKNDAPLSVARGFSKKEWQDIFSSAGITNYTIQWKWAFRYLIVCCNG